MDDAAGTNSKRRSMCSPCFRLNRISESSLRGVYTRPPLLQQFSWAALEPSNRQDASKTVLLLVSRLARFGGETLSEARGGSPAPTPFGLEWRAPSSPLVSPIRPFHDAHWLSRHSNWLIAAPPSWSGATRAQSTNDGTIDIHLSHLPGMAGIQDAPITGSTGTRLLGP